MAALPVEWVLIVYYNITAHRATYGRFPRDTRYSKDYIQLSRKRGFIDAVSTLLSVPNGFAGSIPITYRWPTGNAPGQFVFLSADRPHLKWETSLEAPKPNAWKMAVEPSEATAETIPGNPSHLNSTDADREFELLQSSGVGQPYLMAIKLRDEPGTLHLRAYLANASEEFAWADVKLTPRDIQALIARMPQKSEQEWSTFQSGGIAPSAKVRDALLQLTASKDYAAAIDAFDAETGRELATYLRQPAYGLFFDPTRNHDGWLEPMALPERIATDANQLSEILNARFPVVPLRDAAAEALEVSAEEVDAFREKVKHRDYEVPDAHATVKTRGSAQKVFADEVKSNYGFQCAITGIRNRDFLVAAHIVPWSADQSIRLDPSNGICLSLLVDRAFENGHLLIEDDLTIHVDWDRLGDDQALRSQLEPYDGQKLRAPEDGPPKLEYLQRRRALVNSAG